MRRREFIALVAGAAAAWPIAPRAQQSTMPVVGLLSSVPFDSYADRIVAFKAGLKETGYVEGGNVTLEYRSADGRMERLPELATDLVRRGVAVIVSIGGDIPAHEAKRATATIPIVFATGSD